MGLDRHGGRPRINFGKARTQPSCSSDAARGGGNQVWSRLDAHRDFHTDDHFRRKRGKELDDRKIALPRHEATGDALHIPLVPRKDCRPIAKLRSAEWKFESLDVCRSPP